MTVVETRALFEMLDRQIRFQAWIASAIATETLMTPRPVLLGGIMKPRTVSPALKEVLAHHYAEMDKQDALMEKLGQPRPKPPADNLNATGEISA